MGRDVAGLRIGKNSASVNVKSNGTVPVAVHVAPKALPETVEKEVEPAKGTNPDLPDEKQHEPGEEIAKLIIKESSSPVKSATESPAETSDSGAKSSKSNDYSPSNVKKPQANSPLTSRKQLQPFDKKYYHEDDNWSLASSTATSRTSKFRLTVPMAPTFVCTNRLERRKEFYTKLDEKHKALEQEKRDYEARTKEEEQAAIKQLRKNMAYKANPVPNFYREGPPPKVELKKPPVTRAKSPNLTRRKSCGDAAKSSPVEKALCGRAPRHSVGVYKQSTNSPITPKSKDRNGVRKSSGNGTNISKDRPIRVKESVENSPVKGSFENSPVKVSVENPPVKVMVENSPVKLSVEKSPVKVSFEDSPVKVSGNEEIAIESS